MPPDLLFEQYPRVETVPGQLPFAVRFSNLHQVEARGRYRLNPHQHLNYEIIVVERGSYGCQINAGELLLTAPAVAVLKPGDWHADGCAPPLRYHAITFNVLPGPAPHRSVPILAEDAAPEDQVLRGAAAASFLDLVARLREEGRRRDAFAPHIQDALAGELLWRLLRALPARAIRPEVQTALAEHGFAASLLRLFKTHLDQPLGLDAMATALGLSRRSLTATCAKVFHASPAKLFLRYRIERAQALLRQTDVPVHEVAAHLGFADQYHFSKAYKRVIGVAPTHERRR